MLKTLGYIFVIKGIFGSTGDFLLCTFGLYCFIQAIINNGLIIPWPNWTELPHWTMKTFGVLQIMNLIVWNSSIHWYEIIHHFVLIYGAHELRLGFQSSQLFRTFKNDQLNKKYSTEAAAAVENAKKLTQTTSTTTRILDDIRECPVCFDVIKKKVYQCVNGHVLCPECYSQVQVCPTCRIALSRKPIRNLALEQIISEKLI